MYPYENYKVNVFTFDVDSFPFVFIKLRATISFDNKTKVLV